MKRYMLAALLTVSAVTAHAQGTSSETCSDPAVNVMHHPTPDNLSERNRLLDKWGIPAEQRDRLMQRFSVQNCAQIQATVVDLAANEKSLDQIEAEEAIASEDKAGMDLVNGAQRMISSGQKADVLSGLETLQRFLTRAEMAFGGKGLEACTPPGGSTQWNRLPCDPMPAIKRGIDREFQRLGWPVAASPSAAYTWLIGQYRDGSADVQRQVQDFASSNAIDLLPYAVLAKAEQLNRAQLAAQAMKARQDQRAAQRAANSTLVGNFTSMGDRLWSSVLNWLGSAVALLFILGVLSRLPLPLSVDARRGMGRLGLYVLLAMLPFYAAYVLFGGWWDALARYVPQWLRLLLLVGVFVPAVVLTKRLLPNLRLPSLAFAKGGTAAAAPAGGLHGSAHWSDTQSGIQRGRYQPAGHVLADSHGFALGRAPDHDGKALKGFDSRLRYMGHVLTIAPNGSGKGIGAVIPTLLDYPGSCVVLDIKGENYAVTARFRREKLGHEVYLVDPFGVTGQPSHCFNWLDRLDPDSPDVVGESATLADMLIVAEGHASDASAHFNETAKIFLRGLLVHVATLDPEKRNMGEVRRLLSADDSDTKALLEDMLVSTRGFDLPKRAATAFINTPDKERGSLRSTLNRHLAFLDDPRIVGALSRSDFTLDGLKRRPMTVYLVMPPARLSANRAFVRAFFGQSINAVMSAAEKPRYRVLFLLDEFPQLGRMDIVEEKLPLIRGYGGAFWLVAQNLAQLKETYPRWQNFVANCGGKQFFGTSDVETARYISDTLGKMTVEYRTSGSNVSAGASVSTGNNDSQQFTGRELLTPDEIMRLPREREIVLVTGEAPYLLNRLNYLSDPEYAGHFDANPYE